MGDERQIIGLEGLIFGKVFQSLVSGLSTKLWGGEWSFILKTTNKGNCLISKSSMIRKFSHILKRSTLFKAHIACQPHNLSVKLYFQAVVSFSPVKTFSMPRLYKLQLQQFLLAKSHKVCQDAASRHFFVFHT